MERNGGLGPRLLEAAARQSSELPGFSLCPVGNRSGFLNLGMIDILGWILLCCGRLFYTMSMFINIPGLCPLDANSIPSYDI